MLDGTEEAEVIREAEKLAAHLHQEIRRDGEGVEILGPAPQPVSRLKGKHRWHVTLRGEDHRRLHTLAERALALAEERAGRVRLAVDVDPVSLL
jgi:primosomal protein N' (replication factor Y)